MSRSWSGGGSGQEDLCCSVEGGGRRRLFADKESCEREMELSLENTGNLFPPHSAF